MTDELLSLRAMVVSSSQENHRLFREASSSAAVPIEIIETADAAAAAICLADGADFVYLDAELSRAEIAQIVAMARAVPKPPFTVLLTVNQDGAAPFETDGLAAKPARLQEARQLVERSTRLRRSSRVLVVDDSATMRSIVRKLLAGTRFPLEISEADQGFAALKLVRERPIDIVFLDYNMPDFSGLETLSEFKREKRRFMVVIMTSASDDTLADRAHELGAAFLKKPFYPADLEAVLCRFYGLKAIDPNRR
jgi:CheY-like chemotaxis protein